MAQRKNKPLISDAQKLIDSTVGQDGELRVLRWIDKNFNDAYTKHINETFDKVFSIKYELSQSYRDEVAVEHVTAIKKFLDLYKNGVKT